ncbi:hypothetical protein STVA_41660 [Allostella vacuolata]|nr:hypothetical protein STVA_41660 [Stella vacuolata]
MTTLQDQFLAEIEAYLTREGMGATQFGIRALNDPRFVFDVRRGRICSVRTVDRVRAWMADPERASEAA